MTALDWLWIALGLLWMVGGAWVLRRFLRAPTVRDEPTLDEHAAAATALLQPDSPLFDDETPLADALEAWLREHTQTTTEETP